MKIIEQIQPDIEVLETKIKDLITGFIEKHGDCEIKPYTFYKWENDIGGVKKLINFKVEVEMKI